MDADAEQARGRDGEFDGGARAVELDGMGTGDARTKPGQGSEPRGRTGHAMAAGLLQMGIKASSRRPYST